MKFRVLLHIGVNKAVVGDIFEIDEVLSIVTLLSNRKVYIDNIPFDRKEIDRKKREFIKAYYDGKSWLKETSQTLQT